jgi:photoactive yellow protein
MDFPGDLASPCMRAWVLGFAPTDCHHVGMLKRVCCRCLEVLGTDHTQEPGVTHTFCLDGLPEVYPFEIESVADMTTEMIDALPYGFIRLDTDMRVIAYSQVESQLAQRPRESVMGRHFFEEVAPCTNVRELAGWLSETVRAGRPDTKRLNFIFDFPHGRQLVTISLVHDPSGGSSTLTVEAAA